jgi:hypothetical protein
MRHRSRPSVRLRALCWLSAGVGCVPALDPRDIPQNAEARCGAPDAQDLVEGPRMLPGRNCLACHTDAGIASSWPWTVAGTVFAAPDAPCDGGIGGVSVQLIGPGGQVVLTLATNLSGNFYSSEALPDTPLTARLSQGTTTMEMTHARQVMDCNRCHYQDSGAQVPGRLYLP